MAVEVLMPKMGMTMEEGTILKWLKQVGDQVVKGEVILEIQTDKVKMEVEAISDGVLVEILAAEGSVVPVNKPIAYIGKAGETVAEAEKPVSETESSSDETPEEVSIPDPVKTISSSDREKSKATPAAKRMAAEKGINLQNISPGSADGMIRVDDLDAVKATPLAQKIACDQDIDLSAVEGSGAHGKITKKDILSDSSIISDQGDQGSITPLVGLRKVIAERMSLSWHEAPHASISLEVDMTAMVKLRAEILQDMEKKIGKKVSYNHMLIKVVARALKDNPAINARFIDNGIDYSEDVNIGVAVAAEEGLIVPVLHNADQLTVEDIVLNTDGLIEKARKGELVLNELEGGTFTISNLGMFGITKFGPIINPPEVGILGAGKIVESPLVENGSIVIKPIMSLSLSFDHRAADGAQAALFLSRVKDLMESPVKLL